MTITYLENNLSDEDRKFYEGINPGMRTTGDCLRIEYDSGEACTHVIFTGNHTPSFGIRDCGDHFIHACYSRYDRIDKDTLKVTEYVEDC